MQTIKILVSDENLAVANALRLRLQRVPHFEVTSFSENGTSLLQILQRVTPHVVLLGLTSNSQMNRRITQQLVREAVNAGTAVIVLTPFIDDVERQMAIEAGAHSYLLKTINTQQLIHEINTQAANAQ